MNSIGALLRAVVVLVIGLALGSLVGWLVYSLSNLKGQSLFITGGGLIGLIVSALFTVYTRRLEALKLSEITINVPEFAEMKFLVNSEYRQVAWKLFIETLTRISTQPLESESGSLREALNSLYNLFCETRTLIKSMSPTKPTTGMTVEVFAVKMLNTEIRPFLSKWHVRLQKFEATSNQNGERWAEDEKCRNELQSLQKRLLIYTTAFGELAGIKNPDLFFDTSKSGAPK